MKRIVQADGDRMELVNHHVPEDEDEAAASFQSEDEVDQQGLQDGENSDGMNEEDGVGKGAN